MTDRIKSIDLLKTTAIICVIFYHLGFLKNGYLGVEIFFVLSGFLFVKSNKNDLENKSFKPLKYIFKKISEFWPLLAVCGLVSLAIGYKLMLPDDYENLAESVVASNFFGNNMLQAITTRNYWDVGNMYKPLMHTWYIGVLMQCLVVFAMVLWLGMKIFQKDRSKIILGAIGFLSFVLFLLPKFGMGDKFYYPWFRIFELSFGGLLAYAPKLKISGKISKIFEIATFLLLIFLLVSGINLPNAVLLLCTVIITMAVVYFGMNEIEIKGALTKVIDILSIPGKYSYDIYMWHQVVIAFLCYSVFQNMNWFCAILTIMITGILSFVSVFVRKKVKKGVAMRIIASGEIVIITTALSVFLYLNGGVVRNVPELGVNKENVHRNMHSEYCDIPYSWNKDFTDDTKVHVVVMGNSFARDFANILNESEISDKLEISYIYGDKANEEEMVRVEKADYVFYSTNDWTVSDWVSDNFASGKIYIVGNKKFGNSNGIIYANRNKQWYFTQTVEMSPEFLAKNAEMKEKYKEHYIDMVSVLLNEEKKIRVFTEDCHFISQDCRHLTKFGAIYYSQILDLSFLVK